jgi:hypothetical protein
MVEAAVAGSGEPVPDLITGGGVDGGAAVVGGEVVPAREPGDVTDFGQDAPGDEGADTVELGQV